jgi:predicted ATPase
LPDDLEMSNTDDMALLEREVPLASLAEYADQARRGEGRLVLVSGEAGVGKSALLDQFAADLTGARWCWGACDGLFTPRPLGAFLDIAAQLGGELAGLDRAEATRHELFGALLAGLPWSGGLRVIVVKDIHWADEATLDLLRFLARRIREMPVLIVATYREDELAGSYPLRVALGELAVQRSTRRIELSPLSAQAVRAMAADSLLDAHELHRVTGGNPFYVVEVLHTGLDRVPQSRPFTPRRRATVPPRCTMPRWPGAGQSNLARTGRRPLSWSGRCALPSASPPARWPPATTPWPTRCG